VSRPLKVLHVTRRAHPFPGGIERYVGTLAEGQARAGHRVTVLTLDRDVLGVHSGRLPAEEDVGAVRFERLPGIGGQRFAITARPDRLARAMARADVVHLHDLRFMTGTVAAMAMATRRPLLFHTHGLLYHTPFATRLKHLLMHTYYGPWLRAAGAWVVASSSADLDLLLADVPKLRGRAAAFDNALDLEPFLALPRTPERGLVVVTGRVARHKGIDDLLAALALLEDLPWQLEVAGTEDRAERVRLADIVTRLGLAERVTFAGEFTDAEHHARLSRAAVAAFPSHAEGFGLALLEALAAGVPVVARAQPAHRGVLGEELVDRLVDFGDHAAAAAALRAALDLDPETAATLDARERERARVFALPRLLEEIEQLYGRVVRPA
jgi:alpha-1,3-mannosyltransferase